MRIQIIMTQPTINTTLWCLPYDTDSVFKPFLKIPFSEYLNHLISNEHFPAYQVSVAKEVHDRTSWNGKCWLLISYFEFMNKCFDISVWDSHINFIEDNHLRNIMGFFRLWIDTERLYLLGFLKLDSNQFQEDRIFMCLFRVLIFCNTLFNEYMSADFDPQFLMRFIQVSKDQFEKLKSMLNNESVWIAQAIILLFKNLQRKERVLIELTTLQNIKKAATIKVTKERETIGDVEMRLENSSLFKRSIDEEKRLNRLSKLLFIEDMTNDIRYRYDGIHKIKKDVMESDYYGTEEEREKSRQAEMRKSIQRYKKDVKGEKAEDDSVYSTIEKNHNNPYSLDNYQMYGEVLNFNIEDRHKYQKQKVAEVASTDETDKIRTFYDEGFMQELEQAHGRLGQVTAKDINTKNKNVKKEEYKNQDENTRVFNLKWHHVEEADRQPIEEGEREREDKDYDNNLLFKSPIEERMLNNRKNNLDRLKEAYEVSSYTVALIEQMASEIYPESSSGSQANCLFVSTMPQFIDVKNYKLINHNKFDFMRKVAGYMAAQKKISKIISMKPVPELYPRSFRDVKQAPFDGEVIRKKVDFAMGKVQRQPGLYL